MQQPFPITTTPKDGERDSKRGRVPALSCGIRTRPIGQQDGRIAGGLVHHVDGDADTVLRLPIFHRVYGIDRKIVRRATALREPAGENIRGKVAARSAGSGTDPLSTRGPRSRRPAFLARLFMYLVRPTHPKAAAVCLCVCGRMSCVWKENQ